MVRPIGTNARLSRPPLRAPRRAATRAFSLFELILAVSIIGILAAIAVPRLSQGSGKSVAAALQQDLAVLSKAIELYWAEHANIYPGYADAGGGRSAHSEAAFLAQLLEFTDANGVARAQRGSGYRFGPYLQQEMPALPVGPKQGLSAVKVVTGSTPPAYDATGMYGWVYNDQSGEIIPNIPDATRSIFDSGKVLEGDVQSMIDTGYDLLGGGR